MRLGGDWLRGGRAWMLLCLVCVVIYAPGLASIPPLDRDEARFAQATRQMLESGDFLHIRFQHEARNQKPAGIYWLQAASVAAFSTADSTAIWPYRLPSALGATAAVLLTFALGAALFEPSVGSEVEPIDKAGLAPRAALLGAVLLASALGVAAEAHIAKTDAMLLATIVAGQGVLGLAYLWARTGRTLPYWFAGVFWIAEAGGILLKGPVAPGLAIVTAAVLSIADRDARWLRELRPIGGLVLAALIVAPWVIAIENATEGRFLADSLGRDLLAKLVGAQESHGAPPFYYLLLSVASFWPGSLFLAPALIRGWRHHDAPAERFLLAWIIPAWLFLELVPTKLPHYMLPLYPALALLVGRALAEGFAIERATWAWVADVAVRVLWAIATLVLGAVLIVLPLRFGDRLPAAAIGGAVVLVGLGTVLLLRELTPAATGGVVAAMSAVFVATAGLAVLPGLDRLWLSRAAAALVAAHSPPMRQPIIVVGYSEPSLVFLLGTGIELTTAGAAAEMLTAGGEALVSGREDAMFQHALSARGLAARPLGRVPGIDYSNGQRMVLTLYAVEPG